MKGIVDMIASLDNCIGKIENANEGSMQYFEALRTTVKELQSFFPQSDVEEALEYPRTRINASIKALGQPSKPPKFLILLSLAETLQVFVNQCDISDFPKELKEKLF